MYLYVFNIFLAHRREQNDSQNSDFSIANNRMGECVERIPKHFKGEIGRNQKIYRSMIVTF